MRFFNTVKAAAGRRVSAFCPNCSAYRQFHRSGSLCLGGNVRPANRSPVLQSLIHTGLIVWILLSGCVPESRGQHIEYVPLYTSEGFEEEVIDTSKAVGSISGFAGVSPLGGATYSIPVVVPPGTNGMTPSVALDYQSHLGPGIAGMGWHLSGLSAISRAPQNHYFDGAVRGVRADRDDRFALDGRRLIVLAGDYGREGAVYGMEEEDYSAVTAKGTRGDGPGWFEVITKDGNVMEYGSTPDSRITKDESENSTVVFWRLGRIIRPDGNYIQFGYDNTNGDSRIREILYTGNQKAGIEPYCKIAFHYKLRTEKKGGGAFFSDETTSYEGGVALSRSYLLDRITVEYRESPGETFVLVRSYRFVYGHDTVNSYLKQVFESGTDGEELNPTIFAYGDLPEQERHWEVISGSDYGSSAVIQSLSGDFDGDGKEDLLTASVSSTSEGIRYYSEFQVRLPNPVIPGSWIIKKQELPTNYSLVEKVRVPSSKMLAPNDYTGDGRDDVLALNIDYDGTKHKLSAVTLYENLDSTLSFKKHTRVVQPNYNVIHPSRKFFYTGDFDGDGVSDYLMILGNVAENYNVFFCRRHHAGGACGATSVSGAGTATPDWVNARTIMVLDFDGDGKSDIMIQNGSATEVFTLLENNRWMRLFSGFAPLPGSYPGDYNGDGKTDLLSVDFLTGTVKRFTSSGETFLESEPASLAVSWPAHSQPAGNLPHTLVTGDFNGDGRTDFYYIWQRVRILRPEPGVEEWIYYYGEDIFYSTGDSFKQKQTLFWSENESGEPANGSFARAQGLSNPYADITACDLDGDGKMEIAYSATGSHLTVLSFRKSGTEHLLKKVRNGLGVFDEWRYTTFPYYHDFSIVPTSYPLNTRRGLKGLFVAAFGADDGLGSMSWKQYHYREVKVHQGGKGVLGYGKARVTDQVTDMVTQSEFEVDPTFFLLIPKMSVTRLASTQSLISQRVFDHRFADRGNKRFWRGLTRMSETDALSGVTRSTILDYDEYGNLKKQLESIPGIYSVQTVTEFGAFPGDVPNVPTSVKTENRRMEEPSFFSEKSFQYNDLGQLVSGTEFPGREKSVSVFYEYNDLGNVVSTITASPGLALRNKAYRYDPKGRYQEEEMDELSQHSFATYDPVMAVPTTVTGVEGLMTSFEYDPRGGLRKTTSPERGTSERKRYWDLTGKRVYTEEITIPGMPTTRTSFDRLGREIGKERQGFDGQWSIQTRDYDRKGNVEAETAPRYLSDSPEIARYYYDDYNRLNSVNHPALGVTTYTYSYSNGLLTTDIETASGLKSTTTDPTGALLFARDQESMLSYSYYSHGSLKDVSSDGVILAEVGYDQYARRTSLLDKNAGSVDYEYDAFGQLIWQRNETGAEVRYSYDALGRLTERIEEEGSTVYTYGERNMGGEIKNRLKRVVGFSGISTSYGYNPLGQLARLTEGSDGKHSTFYQYNSSGEVSSVSYPSGLKVGYDFNIRGYLERIRIGATVLYATESVNARGLITSFRRGTFTSTIDYTSGFPVRYFTPGIQDLGMVWDIPQGILSSRTDRMKDKTEYFTHDPYGRLTSAYTKGRQAVSVEYLDNGNIVNKTDVGIYHYHDKMIHAVTGVVAPAASFAPKEEQRVTYSSFMQPNTIDEGINSLRYTYAADYKRAIAEFRRNGKLTNTRYYFEGGYEKEVDETETRFLQYVSGPAGLVAAVESVDGVHTVRYLYTDYLGSVLAVTNGAGDLETEQSFDAWGRRRDPDTWELMGTVEENSGPSWLFRGFTGHEQLDSFGLINMNGRLYDPALGRMLSPDNFVGDPVSLQGYNRYTYARNNPLAYTDPEGEIALLAVAAYTGVSILTNGLINTARDRPFFQNWVSAAVGGALSGGYWGAAVAGLNQHLPSYQFDLGGGFGVSLSPAIAFGGNGFYIGGNLGLNYSSEYFSAGLNYGAGFTKMTLGANTIKGFNTRLGAGFSVGNEKWNAGLYSTVFRGAGTAQRVAGGRLTLGGVYAAYENDGAPFDSWFGRTLNDGGDRFRTSAVSVGYREVDIGLKIFTGDSYGIVEEPTAAYPRGLKTGDADMYRLGALSLGFRGNHIGWNSEGIRDLFQNRFAHDILKPQEYFRRLASGYPGALFTLTTRFRNPYSLWVF